MASTVRNRTAARYFVDGISSTQLRQMKQTKQPADPLGVRRAARVDAGTATAGSAASDDDDDDDDDVDLEGYLQEMDESDDEEDLGALISKFKAANIAVSKGSRRHTQLELKVLSKMREFTLSTLRISRTLGSNSRVTFSNFPHPPSLPEEESPTLEGATVAWDHPLRHPYNRALCLLIAEALVLHSEHSPLFGPRPGETVVENMSDQIYKYLKYLSKKRTQQEKRARLTTLVAREQASFDDAINDDVKRANKRRSDLHERRMDTCARYDRPYWIAILKHARPLSMSSDDPDTTDVDQFKKRLKKRKEIKYYSTLKTWRSPELIEFLRLIDLLTESVIDFGDQEGGSVFRKRHPTPPEKGVRTSPRKPTPKLNKEFYSTEQHKKYGPYYRYSRDPALDLRVALEEIREVAKAANVFIG